MSDTLTIMWNGQVFEVAPHDEFSFGRGEFNDLNLGPNQGLHRRLGLIRQESGFWTLYNLGRYLPLSVLDRGSRSRVTLTSGRNVMLPFKHFSIEVRAFNDEYVLECELETAGASAVVPISYEDDYEPTVDIPSVVLLVGDQRKLATALAEPALISGRLDAPLPKNKEIAHRFGWALTTYNRKLDRMCRKFAKSGVEGLVGSPQGLAFSRREKLVRYLVESGIIVAEDLRLLDSSE